MLKRCGALLAIAALAGCSNTNPRRTRARSGQAGEFDHYLLSLSWAPDYCASPKANRNSRECGVGNHTGFVVHGLWPEFNGGGYPRYCAPARPVAKDIVNRMLTYYPDAGLIRHEWAEHGTCSGLDAAAYFGLVRKAFGSIQIPLDYQSLNHVIDVTPREVERKFADANANFPPDAFRTGCAGGSALREVRVCFTRDIRAMACPALERDCRASSLTMLPVR